MIVETLFVDPFRGQDGQHGRSIDSPLRTFAGVTRTLTSLRPLYERAGVSVCVRVLGRVGDIRERLPLAEWRALGVGDIETDFGSINLRGETSSAKRTDCPNCHGSGQVALGARCEVCGGSGVAPKAVRL